MVMVTKNNKLSRGWIFSIPSPCFDPAAIQWPSKVRYAVWNVTMRGDVNGYVEFVYALKPAKKMLPGAIFEPRLDMDSRDDARNRCMCTDGSDTLDGPWEYGVWELSQGKRTDLLRQEPTPNSDNNLTNLLGTVQHLAREVERLNARVNAGVCHMMPTSSTTINNYFNHYNVNHNTANIVINDVRSEDLSSFPDERLRELISQTRQGFITFVKETRFNAGVPHNHNIRIVSKKQNVAAVKKQGEWKQGTIAQSIEEVLDASKAQFLKPLQDKDYMDHLIEHDPPVMDWCQKVMAKKPCEWRPIKSTVRNELERAYKDAHLDVRSLV